MARTPAPSATWRARAPQVKLSLTLVLVIPVLASLEMGLRRTKRLRGAPNRSAIELLTGLQAGLCIGIGNAAIASGLQSTSRSWLEHVQQESRENNELPETSLRV